jgi:chromosome segregation ATPase
MEMTRIYLTDVLVTQNKGLEDDIQQYIAQISELGQRLDDAEEHVENLNVNMGAMDQARKQINQSNMKESLVRTEAQKEMEILKKLNKSLKEKIEQTEDRIRTELIQDRQKARRHIQVACNEAEQLKQEFKSLHDKFEEERHFAEEQVIQCEMDYQLLQNDLNESEIDKVTFMEKLNVVDEENQLLKDENDKFEDELFEMSEMNSELEEKILKQKEEIEAWAKGQQSQGNTAVAPSGIPVPCKEKVLGLRIGQCKTLVKSTGGGMCIGKTVGPSKGGSVG